MIYDIYGNSLLTNEARNWGYVYTKAHPKITFTSSGCTFYMPSCDVMTKHGSASNVASKSFTTTLPIWISYDITANEFVSSAAVSGHELALIGIIHPSRYEWCYIAGATIMLNKTIAFMGDSITAGSGTSTCYHQYLSDRYGWTCLNYGYGGSGYVRNYPSTGGLVGQGNEGKGVNITSSTMFTPNNVLTRLAEVNPSSVDGVVIFAGTNDWAHGDEVSLANFTSGVDAVFDYYQTNFGKVPLLVMTPIHRKNDTVANTTTGKTLSDYADIIIEECRKYGIPYVDTLSESGLHPDNAGNDTAFFVRDDTNVSDGLHPNHYAHERLMRAVGRKLNGLLTYDNNCMG